MKCPHCSRLVYNLPRHMKRAHPSRVLMTVLVIAGWTVTGALAVFALWVVINFLKG